MSTISGETATPAKRSRSAGRVTVGEVFGDLFITVGAVLLLFAFYEAYWTNLQSGRIQDEKQAELEKEWVNPRENHRPGLGDAFAQLRIPAFGSDYHYAVLEGTDDDTLLAGPGHYSQTQFPGEPGNVALAGHRVGKGAPFNDLGHLKACDEIIVETRTQSITYRVLPMDTDPGQRRAAAQGCMAGGQLERVAAGDYAGVLGRHITVPSDVSVVEPLPGAGTSAESTRGELESLLTLTTCHPQFSNAERMIIHAIQTSIEPKQN